MPLLFPQIAGDAGGQRGDQCDVGDPSAGQIGLGEVLLQNIQAGTFENIVADGAHTAFNIAVRLVVAAAKLRV